jgi:hypothetical protein
MKQLKNVILGLAFITCLFAFSNSIYANNSMPQDEEYALVTDKPAAPVGGIDAMMKKIYSETSLKGKLHGKCYLLVYVNASGGVDDVKVVKGFGGKESDALDVVKEIKFTPGMNGSSAVKSKVAVALNFE